MFYSKSTIGFYDAVIHGENIPADAVEITADEHRALLAGQAAGKCIVVDAEGRPALGNLPEPATEDLAAAARNKRDRLIAETDYLLMPDYPIATAALDAIKAYRQALRDIPGQPDFPRLIDWPAKP